MRAVTRSQRRIIEGTLLLFKRGSHELVEKLSDDATWEDLLREVALRRAIEEGLEDVETGKTVSTEALRERLGVDE